jgi:hypothetical protein
MRSIVHIKDYESMFNFYGIPSNIGAIDAGNIYWKTDKWNLSRLENSFKLSGLLNVVANFSEEDAQTFQDKVTEKFAGESTQGQVMTIINELGGEGEKSTFTPIETNEDGNWTNLKEQAISSVITSNQWFRSLSGLADNTGFDTNRIRNEYQIAINTIVKPIQTMFLDTYMMLFNNHLSMNISDLKVVNDSPISLIDLDNVHQAIIDINKEVAEGRMSEDMAKMTLKLSFSMTEEQVNDLFV